MKGFLFSRCLLLVLCLLISCASAWAQSDNNAPLTNASIVKLVKAGFKEKSIITIIASKPVTFDLSTDRLIELKRTGVTEKVILAMMARQQGENFSDEAWTDDEEFFNQSTNAAKSSPTKPGNSNDGSSTDIFGSSGGSKGGTRSNRGNSSLSGDTITTGSATVKILRPPSEAEGPAKLEKTKSLTNDSVCELVEAGFSEGTIIRRIEQSPVEFDLSAAKIEELRKRRVSEKIIVAMKAAMGDESTK
ncbi:MAG TPA: hypothetical protein VJR02_10330 [Pyrinomonadaceae bacterium]|nr:hypothetical protein [Pyrinomonadaceae bacterium]